MSRLFGGNLTIEVLPGQKVTLTVVGKVAEPHAGRDIVFDTMEQLQARLDEANAALRAAETLMQSTEGGWAWRQSYVSALHYANEQG